MKPRVKVILHARDGRKFIATGDSIESCLHWLINVEAKGRGLQGCHIGVSGQQCKSDYCPMAALRLDDIAVILMFDVETTLSQREVSAIMRSAYKPDCVREGLTFVKHGRSVAEWQNWLRLHKLALTRLGKYGRHF